MKIKALKISGSNNVKTIPLSSTTFNVSVNGKAVTHDLSRVSVIFSLDDKLSARSCYEQIVGYERDGKVISSEEYNAKPIYYNEDSSESEVLRAIANRKEMSGFNPVKIFIDEPVEFDIIGEIEDTKSLFITCNIGGTYAKNAILFTLDQVKIEFDEYLLMAEANKSHARFGKLDRKCLEYVQVNGSYPFGRGFGERSPASYLSLADAQLSEERIRANVRNAVNGVIFKEEPTIFKASQLLARLELAREMADKSAKDSAMDTIIIDLSLYIQGAK